MLIKLAIKVFLFIALTIITQIGGIVFLCALMLSNHRYLGSKFWSRICYFVLLYLLATFVIAPLLAPYFGRVKIEHTEHLAAHSFFYQLANRNYVKPQLNKALGQMASSFASQHPNIKIIYLDANFPFWDGFPLLPHLSHDDGKKIDLTFIYEDENNKMTNKKPGRSGYGIYVQARPTEFDQHALCKKKGYWQYDFTKFLSLGVRYNKLKLSASATRNLAQHIVQNPSVEKIFIEPHLKKRLNLNDPKIRFHGCGAVRHDDHIHLQIK